MSDIKTTASDVSPRSALFLLAGLTMLGDFSRTAYVPAITVIADGLGVRVEAVQMTVSVGLLTSALAGPVIGAVADSMGRRQLLFPALVLYIAGSVLAAVAPAIAWLFLARVFQTLGSTVGMTLTRAIARDLHSGPQLTRLLSGVTLASSLAPVVAPLFGGILAVWLGWQAIFAFAALYGAAVLVSMLLLPETKKGSAPPLSVITIFASYRFILTSRSFIVPTIVGAALISSMLAFVVSAAPIFVKELQFSPAMVGFFPAITVVGLMLGSGLARWAATRVQSASIVRAGSLIALASSIAMACVPIAAPHLIAAITVFSIGFGLALPASVSMAMSNFGDRAGAASALLGAVQSLGGTIGATTTAFIDSSVDRAMPATMIIGSVLAAVLCFSLREVATEAATPRGDGDRAGEEDVVKMSQP